MQKNEATQPMRYYAQGRDDATHAQQIPQDMVAISFTAEECLALKNLLYVLSTEQRVILLNLSPNQTRDETKKRECAVAMGAFRKIDAAHPGSLVIDESKQAVAIPNYTKPHLIELIKQVNSLGEKASEGKAAATSSASAKFKTPGGSSWSDVTSWPSPMTDELQKRKTSAIEALKEISEVIPADLRSNYKGKGFQLFPSQESPTIFVGLIYFTLQLHVKEILHRVSDELKPYLKNKTVNPSSSNQEPIFVLCIKDPDRQVSALKDSLNAYFSQCHDAETESPGLG